MAPTEPIPETLTAPLLAEGQGERPRPRRRVLFGLRTRILLWYVFLLASATAISVLVVDQLLYVQLDERIDQDLRQETDELRALAGGIDPETGTPFGNDVVRIFDVFLERNVPSHDEAFLTFVDGRLHARSEQVMPSELQSDGELVRRWTALTGAGESDAGTEETPAGTVRYLAVPVGDRGVFVAVVFRDIEAAEMRPAVRAMIWVGLAVLVIGSLLAWRVAEGVLGPVKRITTTARSISETDLTRRIPVQGRDEIAMLAVTFNQMLDRLERAFRTQRAFVDDAGHELRTPITIIRGHLELLEVDPEQREQTIALVTDELDRMSRMVNDLLVLAKTEQPDFLDLEAVDIEALIQEIFAKASAIAPRRWNVENVARGRVVADRRRLTQAMIQLAQNAANHTVETDSVAMGSIILEGQVRLWVRDTGPGINYEDQERIFERFARVGNSRGSSESAGLGLAIVRAIAEAHHGRVELLSRPGDGATFTVVFPADQPIPADEGGARK
jgi:signal transduction histidine kinase